MVERGSQDKWPVESQPERGHMYRYAEYICMGEYIYTNICICKSIYIYIKGFIYINISATQCSACITTSDNFGSL